MFFVKKPFLITVAAIVVALIVTLSVIVLSGGHHKPRDARLASPAILLQELVKSGAPVFISPEFLPFVTKQRPLFPTLSESTQGSTDKSVFWRLNREHHYGSVLIAPGTSTHSLVRSLLDSPLWILSDVSPWGYRFDTRLENINEWQLPSEKDLQINWPQAEDRTLFLILTADNLAAIDRDSDAENLLGFASETHRFPSLLLSTQASIAASRGRWEDAQTLSMKSLDKDHSNLAAREILIRALLENGHADEALEQAHKLINRNGENETTLFLLARTANAAHAQQEEIAALSLLVTVAKRDHQPVGASLTYLGQALAKKGDRGEALRTLQEAYLAPELTEAERKLIRDVMDHLMQGNESSSTLPSLPDNPSPVNTNP